MNDKTTETDRTQLQDQLFDLAGTLSDFAETSEDPERATELYLAEHAALYVRWIGSSGRPHPQKHNWKQVVEQNWPHVRDEDFAEAFSLDEHTLAIQRLVEDIWPELAPSSATSTSLH